MDTDTITDIPGGIPDHCLRINTELPTDQHVVVDGLWWERGHGGRRFDRNHMHEWDIVVVLSDDQSHPEHRWEWLAETGFSWFAEGIPVAMALDDTAPTAAEAMADAIAACEWAPVQGAEAKRILLETAAAVADGGIAPGDALDAMQTAAYEDTEGSKAAAILGQMAGAILRALDRDEFARWFHSATAIEAAFALTEAAEDRNLWVETTA